MCGFSAVRTVPFLLVVLTGCAWVKNEKKVTCEIPLYASISAANATSRNLQVSFCSPVRTLPSKAQVIPAKSDIQPYRTLIGVKQQDSVGPYADSQYDACAKMVPASLSGEDMETQIPLLDSQHLADTKTCYNEKYYLMIDAVDPCPDGFLPFDPNTVLCFAENK